MVGQGSKAEYLSSELELQSAELRGIMKFPWKYNSVPKSNISIDVVNREES